MKKQSCLTLFMGFAILFIIGFVFSPVKVHAKSDLLEFHLGSGGRLWDYEGDDLDRNHLSGFYEKGNYFTLEYADGTEDEFDYYEGKNAEGYWVSGYYLDGDPYFEELDISIDKILVNQKIVVGENKADITVRYKGKNYFTQVSFRGVYRINGKFSKSTFCYDGKVHTPSFKLILDDGKNTVIPASEYTYKWDTGRKNVGSYSVWITLKDPNAQDYADNTHETIIINPTKPVITKVKPGKKSFTVRWKKFTSAQQKQITKFRIQYSTDKKFKKGVKTVYASKKSCSKTIKKLKKKKVYYVRVWAFKNVYEDGYLDQYKTRSAVKKVKTR